MAKAARPATTIDMKDKVNAFVSRNKSAASDAVLRAARSAKYGLRVLRPTSVATASPMVATVVATKPGYHLAVGVTELAANTGQAYVTETAHVINRLVGGMLWLASSVVGVFNARAKDAIRKASFAATGSSAKFIETVDHGMSEATRHVVSVLQEDSTVKVVTASSGAIAVGVLANSVTDGRLASFVGKAPTAGGALSAAIKGGKGTWIALGVALAAGTAYTVGAKAIAAAKAEQAELPVIVVEAPTLAVVEEVAEEPAEVVFDEPDLPRRSLREFFGFGRAA